MEKDEPKFSKAPISKSKNQWTLNNSTVSRLQSLCVEFVDCEKYDNSICILPRVFYLCLLVYHGSAYKHHCEQAAARIVWFGEVRPTETGTPNGTAEVQLVCLQLKVSPNHKRHKLSLYFSFTCPDRSASRKKVSRKVG